MMKKLLASALIAGSMFSGAAFAEKYTLLNDGANNSPLHNQGLNINTWNATLTANATGVSTLVGTFVGSDTKTYNINMTLTDTYFAAGKQYWGNFLGLVSGNGRNIVLNDIVPGRDVNSDAVLGINATPYNDHLPGGNKPVLEFGFWGDDSPLAGGTRNSDANVHVACVSGTGAGGPANSNGTCTTGNVPLPGTLALTGIALLGLGLRRKFA
jgi:hypothetical protein